MEFFQKNIKTKEMEPRLFALYLKTSSGDESFLYTGVHYSLDEAFGAARDCFYKKSIHRNPALDLDSWDILTFSEIYEDFSGKHLETMKQKKTDFPTTEKIAKKLVEEKKVEPKKESIFTIASKISALKGDLMKRLVEEKNLLAVSTMKRVFSTAEIKYLEKKISEVKETK